MLLHEVQYDEFREYGCHRLLKRTINNKLLNEKRCVAKLSSRSGYFKGTMLKVGMRCFK